VADKRPTTSWDVINYMTSLKQVIDVISYSLDSCVGKNEASCHVVSVQMHMLDFISNGLVCRNTWCVHKKPNQTKTTILSNLRKIIYNKIMH